MISIDNFTVTVISFPEFVGADWTLDNPQAVLQLTPNPGYQIVRNIETMQPHTELGLKLGGSHSEIIIDDLRVPRENILGGQGQGRVWEAGGEEATAEE